jgi:type IX secretion system PorP/SprF family membrane protein
MKKLHLLFILLGFSVGALAQQRPLFSQYMHNPFLVNPAFAGAEDFAVARSSFRRQWTGLESGPQSYYLTVNGPLIFGAGGNKTTLPVLGKNLLSSFKPDTAQAKPAKLRHGIGVTLISDKMGPTRLNTALLSYAAHFKITESVKGALGASIGGKQWVLDPNALDFESGSDPTTGTANINKLFPALNLGAIIYTERFFFGFSTEQILQTKLDFGGAVGILEPGRLRTHIYATAGYALPAGDLVITPSVMARYVSPVAPALDFNMKVAYKDAAWLGASYRMGSAMAFMAGFKAGKRLIVGYSYDLSMGNAKDLANNSHEIVIGARLGSLENPQKYWW